MEEPKTKRSPWVKVFLVGFPLWLILSGGVGLYLFLRQERIQEESADFLIPQAVSAGNLLDSTRKLAGIVGERNFRNEETRRNLRAAASMIEGSLGPQNMGFRVRATTDEKAHGRQWSIFWVEVEGKRKPGEIVWLFAGYDSPGGSAGMERNATGVAALLALAQDLLGTEPGRTIRIAFVPHAYQEDFDLGEMARIFSKMAAESGGEVIRILHVHGMGKGTALLATGPAGRPLEESFAELAEPGPEGLSPEGLPHRLLEWNLPVAEITTIPFGAGDPEALPDPAVFETAVLKLKDLVMRLAEP